jgi:hypothetical protein
MIPVCKIPKSSNTKRIMKVSTTQKGMLTINPSNLFHTVLRVRRYRSIANTRPVAESKNIIRTVIAIGKRTYRPQTYRSLGGSKNPAKYNTNGQKTADKLKNIEIDLELISRI